MKEKTDHIYNTALAYACYKSGPNRVDEHLLKQMFNDLCLLSDEYGFDYKQALKEQKEEVSMKKYKVILTFTETVEAEDEDDAKLVANENVFASCYSEADVTEIKDIIERRV